MAKNVIASVFLYRHSLRTLCCQIIFPTDGLSWVILHPAHVGTEESKINSNFNFIFSFVSG